MEHQTLKNLVAELESAAPDDERLLSYEIQIETAANVYGQR